MAQAEEHIRELLKLSARERARAAKLLLDSLDDPAGADAGSPMDSLARLRALTGSDADRSEPETADELAELDELASDKEALRAAVRAAVEAEVQPLHELTRMLRQLAERARSTGQVLRARTT